MSTKVTLSQWLEMIDAHVEVRGNLYHPTNAYINVHIKRNQLPTRELRLVDGGANFGRSNGDADKVPTIYEAVNGLLSEFIGNRVTFGGDHVLVVPELDTTGLAEQL